MEDESGLLSSQRGTKRSLKDIMMEEEEQEDPDLDFVECCTKRLYKVGFTVSETNVGESIDYDVLRLSTVVIRRVNSRCDILSCSALVHIIYTFELVLCSVAMSGISLTAQN